MTTTAKGSVTPVHGIDERGVTEMERRVLNLRTEEELSWAAIGRRLGITRQRVSEIKSSLVKKGLMDGGN